MLGHHHHHHHDHDHDHGHDHAPSPAARRGLRLRIAIAALVLLAAAVAATLVIVPPGAAIVVTRFGDPVRVLVEPGLAWHAPAPIEGTTEVDLRLRTTSGGLQDVGTRDGLRVLVQAYIAWQVRPDPDHVRRYLRAVRGPDEAAAQIRSLIGSALEITASRFDLAALVNTDAGAVRFDAFEALLRERIEAQLAETYGVQIRQVGIERLTLPTETLAATVARMRAERLTAAAQRMAEGQRLAPEIRSDADRDARIAIAGGRSDAADIEAKARVEATDLYARAYAGDPRLYTLLRSLDLLDLVVGENTRLILRTDAAPFRSFVEGPAPAPADHIGPGPQAARP